MRIAVTGIGLVTSLGFGTETNWAALASGTSGIRQIVRFDTTGMRATIAGCVDFPEDENRNFTTAARVERLGELAIDGGAGAVRPGGALRRPARHRHAARRDRMAAAAGLPGVRPIRSCSRRRSTAMPLYEEFLFGGASTRLAERFGTTGVPQVVTTACASGGSAIQLAIEAIRRGETSKGHRRRQPTPASSPRR
jgi:3-oxoacyl-[acyl-carrier-protein] synthase II